MSKIIVLMCFVTCLSLICMLRNVQAVQRFCGASLAQALSLLCRDGYNQKLRKRSGFGKPSSSEFDVDALATAETPWSASRPFLSSFYDGMMLTQAHRRQRDSIGAYDECCRKPCSVTEMIAYCHVQ